MTERLGDAPMTKRELFAAMAMQGLCANPAVFASNPASGWSLVNATEAELTGYCATLADRLLATLERGQS